VPGSLVAVLLGSVGENERWCGRRALENELERRTRDERPGTLLWGGLALASLFAARAAPGRPLQQHQTGADGLCDRHRRDRNGSQPGTSSSSRAGRADYSGRLAAAADVRPDEIRPRIARLLAQEFAAVVALLFEAATGQPKRPRAMREVRQQRLRRGTDFMAASGRPPRGSLRRD
jgi:hypothetical protein